nr:hypothetical protein [Tanacetum cinerariifolium]
MAQGSFDERYKLVPKKMSSLKAKQPKRPPPKRTRNVGKSKRTQLTTSSSTKSSPSDNEDLPSTKLSPRSYHRGLRTIPTCTKSTGRQEGHLKTWVERNRDHTQAVIALMLYCLANRQPFNLACFIIRRMYFFRDRRDKVLPYGMILTRLFKNFKGNMAQGSFDERCKLVPKKMSSLKAKQPKRPPPKRTRNVGKSKRAQLTTSSSTKSPPSDNEDLPSTKLSPRSYHRGLRTIPTCTKSKGRQEGHLKTWVERCTTLQGC